MRNVGSRANTVKAGLEQRSAVRAQAGALRRGTGETIRAALLSAEQRDFTALSEATEPAAMIAALDAWFDRVAGAVHAFGAEVLKFIGDGVLAIFPVAGAPAEACEAALRARAWPISMRRGRRRGCRRCPLARHCIWRDIVWQYRRGRPAGFHRHRSGSQPGQPPRRAMPAAWPDSGGLGRSRRRDHHFAGAARRTRAARHRGALRRLHAARCVIGSWRQDRDKCPTIPLSAPRQRLSQPVDARFLGAELTLLKELHDLSVFLDQQ